MIPILLWLINKIVTRFLLLLKLSLPNYLIFRFLKRMTNHMSWNWLIDQPYIILLVIIALLVTAQIIHNVRGLRGGHYKDISQFLLCAFQVSPLFSPSSNWIAKSLLGKLSKNSKLLKFWSADFPWLDKPAWHKIKSLLLSVVELGTA